MRSFMCARVMLVRDSEFPATYPTGYNVLRIYCVADSSTASLQMSRSTDKMQPTYQIAAFMGDQIRASMCCVKTAVRVLKKHLISWLFTI